MEIILSDNFWKLFYDKFNELIKNYNFKKVSDTYYFEIITNDKFTIKIDYCTHPQFDEVKLCVYTFDNITNNKLYENTYLLINNADTTTITLEEPVENFMNKFFDEIIKKIAI